MSTAVEVFKECRADDYLVEYIETETKEKLENKIKESFDSFIFEKKDYFPEFGELDKYSAKKSTETLVGKINHYLSYQ
jgi:hypothetical protein